MEKVMNNKFLISKKKVLINYFLSFKINHNYNNAQISE
jgi:hypothetical protein